MSLSPSAPRKDWLFWAVAAIAVLTVVSGLTQVFAPQWILALLAAESTATTNHFFGIVGMFMALFGGLVLNTLFESPQQSVPVLWAALQKLGAVVAVTLGVRHQIFSKLALLVALTDLVSAVIMWAYWSRVRKL